jgi:hypothetical protein
MKSVRTLALPKIIAAMVLPPLFIGALTAFALPQVEITTQEEIVTSAAPGTPKNQLIKGHFKLSGGDAQGLTDLDLDIHVRARGNSSRNMPKTSFRIKMKTAASVLGMPADKEWVLLANYSDKTLLRNYTAYELSRRFEVTYTPRAHYVELTLNGKAMGNYLIAEQVKISPERVNVDLAGGFLLEIDQRKDSAVVFTTSRSTPYSVKEPEIISNNQLRGIIDYVQSAEDVLYSNRFADPVEGYAKYIDVDSFINIYLVQELFKNQDAANFSSIYLFKDTNGKLKMGPAWDFDLGAGNVNYSEAKNPVGWWVRPDSPWFRRLFEDPAFTAKVKLRWNQLKAKQIDSLLPFIDQTATGLQASQAQNFKIWDILNTEVWPNNVVMGSYAGEIRYLKLWLKTRISWMDSQINSF